MFKLLWKAAGSTLGGAAGYFAVAALALTVGAAGTWRVMSWRAAAGELAAARQGVRLVEHQARINFTVAMNFEAVRLADTETTRHLLEEVPIHVTPAIDTAHPVPCGFVRLFNAGAHDPVPDGACGTDDAPSGIALSEIAQATTENDGAYDVCAAQLTALQDWVRAQHDLSEGK